MAQIQDSALIKQDPVTLVCNGPSKDTEEIKELCILEEPAKTENIQHYIDTKAIDSKTGALIPRTRGGKRKTSKKRSKKSSKKRSKKQRKTRRR
jgi:hypothetical protein